jgi:hypothetical protein
MKPMVIIGGPHDGDWVDGCYSDRPFHSMPVYTGMPITTEIGEEVYEKCAFADDGGTYYAWVHPDLKRPMCQLLAGYRNARKGPK